MAVEETISNCVLLNSAKFFCVSATQSAFIVSARHILDIFCFVAVSSFSFVLDWLEISLDI